MVRGNPAALLWINNKAKKIWKKKYGGKDGKYKKAHKVAYCKEEAALRPIFLRAITILNCDPRVAHKGLGWKGYILQRPYLKVSSTSPLVTSTNIVLALEGKGWHGEGSTKV